MADHGSGTNNRGNVFMCSTSAVEFVPRASAGAAALERSVAIQNVSLSDTAYIGFGSDLTVANGWRVSPSEAVTVDLLYFDTLYCISDASAELRVLVLNAGNTVIP